MRDSFAPQLHFAKVSKARSFVVLFPGNDTSSLGLQGFIYEFRAPIGTYCAWDSTMLFQICYIMFDPLCRLIFGFKELGGYMARGVVYHEQVALIAMDGCNVVFPPEIHMGEFSWLRLAFRRGTMQGLPVLC